MVDLTLPRYQRQQQALGGRVDRTAGLPEQTLADIFTQWSQAAANQAANAGIQNAETEGFQAGLDSEELPQASGATAAGRAFNDAARIAHLTRTRNDIKTRLGEIAINARNLPAEQWVEAFETSAEGVKTGILAEAPDELKGDITAYWADLTSSKSLALLDQQQQSLQADVLTDLQAGEVSLLDDIETAARDNNLAQLTVRQREYETIVRQTEAAGFITEDEATAKIQAMHTAAVMNEVLGSFDTLLDEEGIEAGTASLDRFRKASATELGMSASEKDRLEAAMRARWNEERGFLAAAQANNTAQEKAALAVLRQKSDDAIDVLGEGRMPSQDLNRLMSDLAAAEEFSKLLDLQNAVETQGAMSQIRTLRPQESAQVLAELESKGSLSGDEGRLLSALRGYQQDVTSKLENDPRTLAREQEVVEDQPLDFSSQDALALSIAERVPGSQTARQRYETAVPPITEAEADQIGRFWSQQDPDTQLGIATAMAEGLGPDAEDVLRMIDSKGYRVISYAGGLASYRPEAAAAVMRGRQFLQAKDGEQLMPSGVEKASLDAHVMSRLDNAFQFTADLRTTAHDAVLAWYADRSQAEGDFSQLWDRARADRAIEAVVGNLVEDRSGGLNPLMNGSQDQFDAWIDSIDASTIEAAGGEAIDEFTAEQLAERIKTESRLISVAPGVFRVTLEDPTAPGPPKFVENKRGEWLELTFDPAVQTPFSLPKATNF